MNILITGSDGFIAKNLHIYFSEIKDLKLLLANRNTTPENFRSQILSADWIFHLAGVNRPQDDLEFFEGNTNTTNEIIKILLQNQKSTPIVYSSSTQAELDNSYGKSKKQAEEILLDYRDKSGAKICIYRFPNVFGKFAKPNYNSVVATFCHNISRSLPIQINDPTKELTLVFVEDICKEFESILKSKPIETHIYNKIDREFNITLQDLADTIFQFQNHRTNLTIPSVGRDLIRALYSTYISYLPISDCKYSVPEYKDPRGRFIEMLKTESSGQFSFFTAPPGATRGRHYHNTKTEKFLIIQGKALFRFQHWFTKEYYKVTVDGSHPEIVDTIPGWIHDITNIGETELIVMLWANEVFDRENPDTFYKDITSS